MFTALTLTLAMGAPVPPSTAPVPAGAAPRVLELKADANGKITLTVVRTEMVKVQAAAAIAPAPGNNAPPPVVTREVPVQKQVTVELGEIKDLVVTTADGKKIDKEDALKRLANGGIVVASSDGKPVSPVFLKVFKDDTLVLTSPELVAPQGQMLPGVVRPLPGNRVPLPAVQPGIQVLPVQGGVQIEVLPAAPAPQR
jgi:hypothetical protein